MCPKEIGWKGTDCTHLVHDRTWWHAVENKLSNYLCLRWDCPLWRWSRTTLKVS